MRRLLLALALALGLDAGPSPVAAATITTPLTAGWTKIAPAGSSVVVENVSPGSSVVIGTSASGAPAGTSGLVLQRYGDSVSLTLAADLYALAPGGNPSALVAVENGVSAGGGSGTISGTSLTQTVVTLPAGMSTSLVAANGARKYLAWAVTGTNPMTVAPGLLAAVVGAGMNFTGNSGAGTQGGSYSFEGPAIPTGSFSAISAGGTTVTVWEAQ